MFTKTFGKLKLVQNYRVHLSQIITKIVMLWWSFGCLEAASTASLAALIVAKGSVSDIMDLLDLADF